MHSTKIFFHYQQSGDILSCSYQGGVILQGHLIGRVDAAGNIDMRYYQVNGEGKIMTGICRSRPEVGEDGKITLFENWQWTSGDHSGGTSILKEI